MYNGISEVRGIVNVKSVRDGYQTVQAALLDYTLTCYPTIQVRAKIVTLINTSLIYYCDGCNTVVTGLHIILEDLSIFSLIFVVIRKENNYVKG